VQSHPQDDDVLILDSIAEARVFNPGWLQRRFLGATLPKAAIHRDAALEEFCRGVDYEGDGFCNVFNRNRDGLSHSLGTVYTNGKLDYIYDTKLYHERVGEICPQRSEKAFIVHGMEHYGRWHDIFQQYGDYVRPAFGREFGLRIVSRSEPELRLHTDHKRYDKIACTPLGADKDATIVQAADGSLIAPQAMSTVFTRRGCVHSSPPSDAMRVIISAAPIERDPIFGVRP
jgi:hypothetical protein